jgi:hypothetical protein
LKRKRPVLYSPLGKREGTSGRKTTDKPSCIKTVRFQHGTRTAGHNEKKR